MPVLDRKVHCMCIIYFLLFLIGQFFIYWLGCKFLDYTEGRFLFGLFIIYFAYFVFLLLKYSL